MDRQTFDELLLTNRDAAEKMTAEIAPLLETIGKVVPDAALRFEIVHDEEEHTNRLQQVRVCFIRNCLTFYIMKMDYPKTVYHVYVDTSDLRYVDNYSKDRVANGLTRPKNIGVLTARKIDEWVAYHTQYYRDLARINAGNERTISEYRRRLEALSNTVWDKDHKSGCIERNGLCYHFSIGQTGISERISLDYRCRTLDDFLLLADNKYLSEH